MDPINQPGAVPTTPPSQQPAADPQVDRSAVEQEVLNKLFNGKYQSLDEAQRGFWELTNYASRAHEALQERMNPAMQATQRQSAFEALERESLVNGNLLRQAIQEEAGAIASDLVNRTLAPLQAAAQARDVIAREQPEYLRHELEIQDWLNKNPNAARDVNRLNQLGAFDLAAKQAYQAWRTAVPPASSGDGLAKAQAQLPGVQVPGQRQLPDQMNGQDMRAAALEYARRTGDKRPAYAQVFPNFQVQLPQSWAAEFQR